MTQRIFDDQDAFEPAAHGARPDGGYLFGGDSWEQNELEHGDPTLFYRYVNDSPSPPRRRRPVPTQAQPYVPRRAVARYDDFEALPELDEYAPPPPRPRPTQARTGQTRSGRRAAAQRARMRRRRSLLLLMALIAVTAVVVDLVRGSHSVILAGDPATQTTTAPPVGAPTQPEVAAIKAVKRPAPAAVPARGIGAFVYVPGISKVFGTAGTLRRYQVVVEKGLPLKPAAFAASVDATLSDPRSWIAGHKVRFQRVPQGQSHDFIIYLATEVTSEKMCAVGGLKTERYTSCRLPGQVIINLTRWLKAVPNYGAPLALYQQYVINHEVGHQLELGHVACGGKGQLAPVMQQQTLGLNGCKANAWPYVKGTLFSGNAVP